MTDPRAHATSFGQDALNYDLVRPSYPVEAVEWLLQPWDGARPPKVADVGAGTGKLTRVLLELGADVVAIDPDREMLKQLRLATPLAYAKQGSAEALPLHDASVDFVTVGQAWHWVEPLAASREIGRVLRPQGSLGLIWNMLDESEPWVARFSTTMPRGGGTRMLENPEPPFGAPFQRVESQTWRWSRPMTRSALLKMASSRSFFLTASREQQEAYRRELGAVLDDARISSCVTVEVPYVTQAFRISR